jgi:hypothetical protein
MTRCQKLIGSLGLSVSAMTPPSDKSLGYFRMPRWDKYALAWIASIAHLLSHYRFRIRSAPIVRVHITSRHRLLL